MTRTEGLCNNYQKEGSSKTRGAQSKLTVLGRGVKCKFLGKWGGGGLATEKLALTFKYQSSFTKSCTHYFVD